MFTGLIQHVGTIHWVHETPEGLSLALNIGAWHHQAAVGESIAINGCCLTVKETSQKPLLEFDVVYQTLRNTTLGEAMTGDRVNLEACVTPSTLLGGHLVQGHVDGIATARRLVDAPPGEVRLRIDPPAELMDFISRRGSVTIDGVSLTIAEFDAHGFEVALIPTTLAMTNLGRIQSEPCPVNIETDCIARMVAHWLSRQR